MKVFDGKAFLETKACKITFSTGLEIEVKEFSDEILTEMDSMQKSTEPGQVQLRRFLAKISGKDAADFATIGLIELKGAMDFLTENFFGVK